MRVFGILLAIITLHFSGLAHAKNGRDCLNRRVDLGQAVALYTAYLADESGLAGYSYQRIRVVKKDLKSGEESVTVNGAIPRGHFYIWKSWVFDRNHDGMIDLVVQKLFKPNGTALNVDYIADDDFSGSLYGRIWESGHCAYSVPEKARRLEDFAP